MPRSLVWSTDLDVLPLDSVVEQRDGYLVVRSPSNPEHYWGNLLLFDEPPARGDAEQWEERFEAAFAAEPRVRHRTFAWDRIDGVLGCAREEFAVRGYRLEETHGLIAAADGLRAHPRENREVVVRVLDPAEGADAHWWDAVVELQVAAGDPADETRTFRQALQQDRRALFRAGRGAWYVAHYPGEDEPVGSCGVVVTGGRGRYQVVDTAAAYRRRGICSRLLVEAARHATEVYGAERFVIGADPGYHALGLYESLGFEAAERVGGVWRRPPSS
jgi:ribosomal protein S18 acetylase RimI-like enzyme